MDDNPGGSSGEEPQISSFVKKILRATGIIAGAAILIVFLWRVGQVLVLVFTGILFAVCFTGLRGWVREHSPIQMSENTAIAAVWTTMLALLGISLALTIGPLVEQTSEMVSRLPEAISTVQGRVQDHPLGKYLVGDPEKPATAGLSGTFQILNGTLGMLGSILIVLFVAIYMSVQPRLYTDGVIRLVPQGRRRRFRQVLQEIAVVLRWWMLGRLTSMAIVGILTTAGLMFLGVPLALTLGFIVFILDFVPNIGPLLAFFPAAMLAWSESPQLLGYTAILYFTVQMVEAYIFSPLIERKSVHLPPAVVIVSQVLLGASMGMVGVFMATPLVAAAIVAVQMLYVEDCLGDEVRLISEHGDS